MVQKALFKNRTGKISDMIGDMIMTDLYHSGNKFDLRYPKRFFSLMNIINKQPFFINDNNSKTFTKTLLTKIYQKALELQKPAFIYRTQYKNVLCTIISNAELYISMPVYKDIFTFDSEDYITDIASENSTCAELYNAYEELNEYIDFVGEKLNKISYGVTNPEWTSKDALVGALRNRKQLDACLKYNFYHVPVDSLSLINIVVNYIAVYQSKNLFGDFAGVKYWGRVIKCEIVDRCDINEIPSKSTKKYYKFTVDSWNELFPPVESAGSGTVFCFTNLYMLLNAVSVNELYFGEKDEFMLYNAIRKAIFENLDNVAYKYRDTVFVLKNNMLSIYRDKRLIYAINQNEYMKNIGGNFLKIKKLY